MSLTRTGIPYLDFAWNPGGCGCSKGCSGCWAHEIAPRVGKNVGCRDCSEFKVHMHHNRLADPAVRAKAAVVGVQFTGDLFDVQRPDEDIFNVFYAALHAAQHTYVFLTQQYARAAELLAQWYRAATDKMGVGVYEAVSRWFYIGTTCHTQHEYNQAALSFANSLWQWWVSAEPLQQRPISPGCLQRPKGIIIGADNRITYNCGTAAIAATAKAFADEGVKVYVKQAWIWRCPRCGLDNDEHRRQISQGPPFVCPCGVDASNFRGYLETAAELLPQKMRMRDLPWQLTMGQEP